MPVAIKLYYKKMLSPSKINEIRHQIQMYKVAQHPNVVSLEAFFETKEHIYLVLELHSRLTLYEFSQERPTPLSELRVREIASKIAIAIEHLHDHGAILRNLEATGILMTEHTEANENSAIPRISRLDRT
mmetsp:Transcript_24022/g.36951  ORF Transcript_24022/g.36951 Transcript_24022/m.36951 type:complete len:130 (+) Transcript_24022:2893-3282(+)